MIMLGEWSLERSLEEIDKFSDGPAELVAN